MNSPKTKRKEKISQINYIKFKFKNNKIRLYKKELG